ncbi:hypothetical protein ACQ86N_17350 [Puia sp. P3]|uniref:hypothetical protein n=1 Tax=Puia sp. P3 TaxID=3423952 RepID=UPI003D66BCE7
MVPQDDQESGPVAVKSFNEAPACCCFVQKSINMDEKNLFDKMESDDNIDRAGFIKCMAWAGTGVLWMMTGGVLKSFGMSQMMDKHSGGLKKGSLSLNRTSALSRSATAISALTRRPTPTS